LLKIFTKLIIFIKLASKMVHYFSKGTIFMFGIPAPQGPIRAFRVLPPAIFAPGLKVILPFALRCISLPKPCSSAPVKVMVLEDW
jgi:hypothetical protein